MKNSLALLLMMSAFTRHAHAGQEIMPLEKRTGQHWNSMKIAYGMDDGCTGLRLMDEFTITRDGAKATISTTATVTPELPSPTGNPKSALIVTPPVGLSHDLYEVIVQDFLVHLKRARNEMDVKENLAKYPESIPFDQVSKRMGERGEIAGAKATGFVVVIFNHGVNGEKYIDAFVRPASLESFAKWLDSYRRYAAPQYVK